MVSERSIWCVISEGCPSVTSEKHMTWGLIGVPLDVSDELNDGTSHEVWFINLVSVTDGGHVFLEGQRHPQASLVWMFGHRQFLSSFWILEITRFTVSSIRSSLGLWVRGFFFRPHRVLVSGSCWLFFIGFTPVQQSSQEYLGVLVGDSFRWILENILKGNSRVNSWCEYLEVVISGHTEPTQGTACPLESSDFRDISNQRNSSDQVLSRLRSSSGVGNPISPSLTSLGLRNPCEVFLYLNCGHDMKPIGWWSYRVRVKYSLVCWKCLVTPVQLWCRRIPIRIVNWGHPSSCLGNLNCPSIYTIASLQNEGRRK